MRVPEYSSRFHRDVKLAAKRGRDMGRLKELLSLLIAGEQLPQRFRDHALKNDWSGYRDAHIQPDWVLIYCIEGDVIRFERTGTHSDLFD